jgi:hypothetical protein
LRRALIRIAKDCQPREVTQLPEVEGGAFVAGIQKTAVSVGGSHLAKNKTNHVTCRRGVNLVPVSSLYLFGGIGKYRLQL